MRCIMKIAIPVERGNEMIHDGSLGKSIESILSEMKPESVYFCDWDGKRTGIVVFDLKDPSQIPAIAEPWFLAFNAQIEIHPCMNLEDLKKSAPGMQQAVKKHHEMKKAA